MISALMVELTTQGKFWAVLLVEVAAEDIGIHVLILVAANVAKILVGVALFIAPPWDIVLPIAVLNIAQIGPIKDAPKADARQMKCIKQEPVLETQLSAVQLNVLLIAPVIPNHLPNVTMMTAIGMMLAAIEQII